MRKPSHSADHLLVAALALQTDLLNNKQFAEVCALWKEGTNAYFADMLAECGWLTSAGRQDVERLAERKLRKHEGNVQAALAELAGDSLRQAMVAAGYNPTKDTANKPRSWLARLRRLPRSYSPVNLAAIGVGIAVTGISLALFLFPTSTGAVRNPRSQPSTVPADTEAKPENDPELPQDFELASYLQNMHRARRAWREEHLESARQLLEEQRPKQTDTKDLRGFEWYFLRRLCREERLSLPRSTRLTFGSPTGFLHGLAFSPDASRLAAGGEDGAIRIWDTASGAEVFYWQEPRGRLLRGVSFSPDGLRLATGTSDGRVLVWQPSTKKLLLAIQAHAKAITSVAFSPSGWFIASASNDRRVCIWNAATGMADRCLDGHPGAVLGVAYSPEGQDLAAACEDGTVWIWHASTGAKLHTLPGHTSNVTGITYSPDGRQLATASQDGSVRLWAAESGKELRLLRARASSALSLAYSPDGHRLATAGSDGAVRLWETASGKEVFSFGGSAFADVVFSSDGQRLAAIGVDGSVQIWESTAPSAELLQRREAGELVEALFVQHPDKYDVIEQLRRNAKLPESLRKEAVARAERHHEDALQLNNMSWYVVRELGKTESAYRRALRQVEEACRQEPENGYYLNTLGVAQYRLGLYVRALETLKRSDKINQQREGTIPADVAFLAMSYHRLGHKDLAEAARARLRTAMKLRHWYADAESDAFLKEVEALLGESNRVEDSRSSN
jgi:hypothetical protein